MRAYIVLALVALIFAASVSAFVIPNEPINEKISQRLFAGFIKKYSKVYQPEEYKQRFAIFQDNIRHIQKLNSESSDANFGITKFADLTPAEFKSMFLLKNSIPSVADKKDVITSEPTAVPAVFDWRPLGAVTPVKNQEQCGSCWAFSVTENIESMWILAGKGTNATVDLAPQQIVDCDTSDDGCNGGDPPTAYQYIMNAGGLEPEKDYPYTAQDGTCKFNKADVAASITGWKYATTNKNEQLLQQNLVSIGPLSICVDAASWQYYLGGIIREICGQTLDHCVQLVGYNTSGSTPYWIIRNSWGADWGEAGYVFVEMWKNLCGITNEATTSTVASN